MTTDSQRSARVSLSRFMIGGTLLAVVVLATTWTLVRSKPPVPMTPNSVDTGGLLAAHSRTPDNSNAPVAPEAGAGDSELDSAGTEQGAEPNDPNPEVLVRDVIADYRRYCAAAVRPSRIIGDWPASYLPLLDSLETAYAARTTDPNAYLSAAVDLEIRLYKDGRHTGAGIWFAKYRVRPAPVELIDPIESTLEVAYRGGETLWLLMEEPLRIEMLELPVGTVRDAADLEFEPVVTWPEESRSGGWVLSPAGSVVARWLRGQATREVPELPIPDQPAIAPWALFDRAILRHLGLDLDRYVAWLSRTLFDRTGRYAVVVVTIRDTETRYRGMPVQVGNAILFYDRQNGAIACVDSVPVSENRDDGPERFPLAVSPYGDVVALANRHGGEVSVWRRVDDRFELAFEIPVGEDNDGLPDDYTMCFHYPFGHPIPQSPHPTATFGRNGTRLVVSRGMSLSVWDVYEGECLLRRDVPSIAWFDEAGDDETILGFAMPSFGSPSAPGAPNRFGGLDVRVDLAAETPELRFLPTQLDSDTSEPLCTATTTGGMIRIVYVDEDDNMLKMIELPK